jgi:hypothetical protein
VTGDGAFAGEGGARGGGVPRDGGRGCRVRGGVAVDEVESCCAWPRLGAGGGGFFFFGPPLAGPSLSWASRTKLLIKSMFSEMTASSMPWALRSPRKAIQDGSTPEDVKPFSGS